MPAQSPRRSPESPVRGRVANAALIVLALVGLVDAGFLAWDHQVFLLNPAADSGICQSGGGCEISRLSYWSEVPLGSARPGLPIALLGAAFFAAVIALAWRQLARPEDPRPTQLVMLSSLGACAYSVVLAGVSFGAQGKLCPYCAVLYAINFLLLAVAIRAAQAPFARSLAQSLRAVLSPIGGLAFAVFFASVAGGYAVYAAPLYASLESRHQRQLEAASRLGETPAVAMPVEGRPSLGPPGAPAHIIEVGDLECPYCRRLFRALHDIALAQPERVRVTFIHYPLDSTCNPLLAQPFHKEACRLAVAAECAHKGDRFFEMADWLFASGPATPRAAIVAQALQLGLDAAAFEACLDDPAVVEAIQADIRRGVEAGVKGTPNFFVNGHQVVGARERDVIEAMIDAVAPRPGDARSSSGSTR